MDVTYRVMVGRAKKSRTEPSLRTIGTAMAAEMGKKRIPRTLAVGEGTFDFLIEIDHIAVNKSLNFQTLKSVMFAHRLEKCL